MRLRFIILSLLLPGFGYLKLGHMRGFYSTILLLFIAIAGGTVLRLFPEFSGFIAVMSLISIIHFGTALHAIFSRNVTGYFQNRVELSIGLTAILLLTTVTCFGNSATTMGFDRVSMTVPVMEPTIRKGEQLLVDTWRYRSKQPQRGEIIIHRFAGQKGIYLNRIIGTPGDSVEIRNGTLYINGKSLIEEYVQSANAQKAESLELQPIIVPSNNYFVMGDNRDKSFGDSRFSGMVNVEDIKGKITCILYSTDKSRIGKDLESVF